MPTKVAWADVPGAAATGVVSAALVTVAWWLVAAGPFSWAKRAGSQSGRCFDCGNVPLTLHNTFSGVIGRSRIRFPVA